MNTPAEKLLIRRVLRGQRDAAQQLVERHERSLWLYLYRTTGSRDVAEDSFQECWARFFEALPGFRGESSVRTYLFRIAHRLAMNATRRGGRAAVSLDEEPSVADDSDASLMREDDQRMAQRVLSKLSDRQRHVLVLRYMEEMTYEEVASVLGIQPATARHYAHEGLQRASELCAQRVTT